MFNHVSKFEVEETEGDSSEKASSVSNLISQYKQVLLQKAYEIYCRSISDKTQIAGVPWTERKLEVIGKDDYKEKEWYKGLNKIELATLESLIEK